MFAALFSVTLLGLLVYFIWNASRDAEPIEIENFTKEKPWRKLVNIEEQYCDRVGNPNAELPDLGTEGEEVSFWCPSRPKDAKGHILTCLYWYPDLPTNGILLAKIYDKELSDKVKNQPHRRIKRPLKAIIKNYKRPSSGYVEVLMWWEKELAKQ